MVGTPHRFSAPNTDWLRLIDDQPICSGGIADEELLDWVAEDIRQQERPSGFRKGMDLTGSLHNYARPTATGK